MRQLKKQILSLLSALVLLLSTGMTVLASGEGNIDGGGGGMGQGTATDVWHSQDGVRITVVTESGAISSVPFDLSNFNIADSTINFGHMCKLQPHSLPTPITAAPNPAPRFRASSAEARPAQALRRSGGTSALSMQRS